MIAAVALASIPSIISLPGFGTTQIGSFFEKSEYTEEYIVIMSREPKTNTSRKQYCLPAVISRINDVVGSKTSRNWLTGEETEKIEKRTYHIWKIYFNNNGYLDFSENEEKNIVY